jgi:predicted RNA binding protein with dsRBD fold (UPF0201 family)
MKVKLGKKEKIVIGIIILLLSGFIVGTITLSIVATRETFLVKKPVERIVAETVGRTVTLTVTPQTLKAAAEIAAIPASSEIQLTRMEIFTASMTIEVEDVKLAVNEVMNLAKQLNGYVSGSSITTYNEKEIATITIRVPRDKFYIAINMISQFGNVTNLDSRSQDVTEEYIDLKARRDNLLKQEERLKEILKLARSVDEILKVEKELERIRGQIESLTGRINYLENRVELSTITVRFVPKTIKEQPIIDWFKPIEIGIQAFYTVVFGLIVIAFGAAPIAAIAIPTYYVYKQRRRLSNKK